MSLKPHVSITKQREAYARVKGICIICGKKLSASESRWSVDHFIPRAIYKWVPDKKTKELIESVDNIFVVHPQCNFSKDSALPTNQAIKNMHAEKKVKDTMRDLYKEAEDSIVAYRAMKQSTLDGQKKRCAICGKQLSLNNATMRRINNHKGRNRENAMCLCDKCNIRAGSPGQKRRMINKRQRTVPCLPEL
ncbi:MAG: hypothetical protein IJI25_05660 [Eubacterium sp.]|nr:hypothetical protein [Eubacterium sp.]